MLVEEDEAESTTCPTCGYDESDTVRGMKIHHAKAHGDSIAGRLLRCDYCEETFRREHNPGGQSDQQHFCDPECQRRWMEETWQGDDHPAWKRVWVECAMCGEEKLVPPAIASRHERHFCGTGCLGEWRSEAYQGRGRVRRIRTYCDYCWDPLDLAPFEYERSNHHYCDTKCMGRSRVRNWRGQGHPLWKGGGIEFYGPSWAEQRRKALRRAERACEGCGMTMDESHEAHGRELDVHHIVPFRYYGVENHETANRLSNLLVVCRECHAEVEPSRVAQGNPAIKA